MCHKDNRMRNKSNTEIYAIFMEQRERVFYFFVKANLTCACSFLGIVRLCGKLLKIFMLA